MDVFSIFSTLWQREEANKKSVTDAEGRRRSSSSRLYAGCEGNAALGVFGLKQQPRPVPFWNRLICGAEVYDPYVEASPTHATLRPLSPLSMQLLDAKEKKQTQATTRETSGSDESSSSVELQATADNCSLENNNKKVCDFDCSDTIHNNKNTESSSDDNITCSKTIDRSGDEEGSSTRMSLPRHDDLFLPTPLATTMWAAGASVAAPPPFGMNVFTFQDTRMAAEEHVDYLVRSVIIPDISMGDGNDVLGEDAQEDALHGLYPGADGETPLCPSEIAELEKKRMQDITEKKLKRQEQQTRETKRRIDEELALRALYISELTKSASVPEGGEDLAPLSASSSAYAADVSLTKMSAVSADAMMPCVLEEDEGGDCALYSDNSSIFIDDEKIDLQEDLSEVYKSLRRCAEDPTTEDESTVATVSQEEEEATNASALASSTTSANAGAPMPWSVVSRYPLGSRSYVERIIFAQRNQQLFALLALLTESYHHAIRLHQRLMQWYLYYITPILRAIASVEEKKLLEETVQHCGTASLALGLHALYMDAAEDPEYVNFQITLPWKHLFTAVKAYLGVQGNSNNRSNTIEKGGRSTSTSSRSSATTQEGGGGSICYTATILHSMELFQRQRHMQMAIRDAEQWVMWYYHTYLNGHHHRHHASHHEAVDVNDKAGEKSAGIAAHHNSGNNLYSCAHHLLTPSESASHFSPPDVSIHEDEDAPHTTLAAEHTEEQHHQQHHHDHDSLLLPKSSSSPSPLSLYLPLNWQLAQDETARMSTYRLRHETKQNTMTSAEHHLRKYRLIHNLALTNSFSTCDSEDHHHGARKLGTPTVLLDEWHYTSSSPVAPCITDGSGSPTACVPIEASAEVYSTDNDGEHTGEVNSSASPLKHCSRRGSDTPELSGRGRLLSALSLVMDNDRVASNSTNEKKRGVRSSSISMEKEPYRVVNVGCFGFSFLSRFD